MARKVSKTLQKSMYFWILLCAIIPLGVSLLITYNQQAASLERENMEKLTTIRDMKINTLDTWFSERERDLLSLAANLKGLGLEVYIHQQDQRIDAANPGQLLFSAVTQLAQQNEFYDEVYFIDAASKLITISSEKNDLQTAPFDTDILQIPSETRSFYSSPISRYPKKNIMTMNFAVPILGTAEHTPVLGVLAVRVNLEKSLYPLLENRTGMGNTGETLIVDKSVTALNRLRWIEAEPLTFTITALPAVSAAGGRTGIAKTDDYRGVPVLAAYSYIPRTEWGFIAKQDISEIYSSLQALVRFYVVLAVSSILVIFILIRVMLIGIMKPFTLFTVAAKTLQIGDKHAQIDYKGYDELETLANALNSMANTIEERSVLDSQSQELLLLMSKTNSIETFRKDFLENIMRLTDSEMGAYYIVEQNTQITAGTEQKVLCVYSKGCDPETLRSCSYDGDIGQVFEAESFVHIPLVTVSDRFHFKTFAGTVSPAALIGIPVRVEKNVSAIVLIASLKPYTQQHLALFSQNWMNGLSLTVSNLRAKALSAELAKNLESINQELKMQSEELSDQATELAQQAEELQDQNSELEIQRDQVEEANRLKSEFLSNMSHELRTPLNSILALSRVMLLQQEKLEGDHKKYVEIVERNGRQLLDLINDILDLSKIEAGKIELSHTECSLQTIVKQILENHALIAQSQGITLESSGLDTLPIITSDEKRIHQVLQNLISNAVKFTHDGSVQVFGEEQEGTLLIHVKDTGIGIDKKDFTKIFQEFNQADGSTARKYGGTGLGLSIAKKAAQLIGGDISLQSEPGRGSIFSFSIPKQHSRYAPHTAVSVSEHIPSAVSPLHSLNQKDALAPILVVDDDPNVRNRIATWLEEDGYETLQAGNGAEAYEIVTTHPVSAITLDIIMPEIDGWEFLQKLRAETKLAAIPTIIVSVSPDVEMGTVLGAVGHLSKPVAKDELLQEVFRVCDGKVHEIMIVDDSEVDLAQTVRLIAGEPGLQPIPIGDGKTFLENLETYSLPDVLLLDLMMPDIDGFEVVRRLRQNPETENLPIIIMTARDLSDRDMQKLEGNVQAIIEKQAYDQKKTRTLFLKSIHQAVSRNTKRLPPTNIPGKLLFVEDNDIAVIQIRAILEHEGFEVFTAKSASEAMKYLKEQTPDAMITDLMMPEIDGFSLIQYIRKQPAISNLPIMVLTAKDLTEHEKKILIDCHIYQLMQKGSIHRQELLDNLSAMLQASRGFPVSAASLNSKAPLKEASAAKKSDQSGLNNTLSPEQFRSGTLLVVEDNPDNVLTLQAVLGKEHTLIHAADGEKALKKAAAHPYDLIFLDLGLPDQDGFAVLPQLRSLVGDQVPIIALTAHTMEGMREKTLKAGFDDFFPKPIDPVSITELVQKWLSHKR